MRANCRISSHVPRSPPSAAPAAASPGTAPRWPTACALLGSCPKCGGELRFARRPAPPSDRRPRRRALRDAARDRPAPRARHPAPLDRPSVRPLRRPARRRYPARRMRRSAVTEQHAALAREWRTPRPRRDGRRGADQPRASSLWLDRRRRSWNVLLGARRHASSRVIAFRGLVDVLAHRFIPRASLYGADARAAASEDVVARRRRLVLAHEVPPLDVDRRRSSAAVFARRQPASSTSSTGRPRSATSSTMLGDVLPGAARAVPAVRVHAPDAVPRQLPDPLRAAAVLRRQADEGLRAGRRGLGRASSTTSAARPSPRRTSPASSSCGSRARSSARPAASPSAACCSSARRAPARRCSPRRSRRRSTRRS